MPESVLRAIGLENMMAPTHSADDEYPDGMFEIFSGWFAAAIMAWREY